MFLPERPAGGVDLRRAIVPGGKRAALDRGVDQVAGFVLGRRVPDLEADQDGGDQADPEDNADGCLNLDREGGVETRQPEDGEGGEPLRPNPSAT